FPAPSTRLPTARLKVPCPSATVPSTTNVPVNVDPGRPPARAMLTLDPSLSWKVRTPIGFTTGTEVVSVTVTVPAAVGDGSLSVKVAVGPAAAEYSTAPASQLLPLLGRF